MPGFKVEVKHGLEKAEAVERLQGFSARIKETYQAEVTDIQETWSDDGRLEFSFKAMGFKISGNASVEQYTVQMDGSLPIAAMMFRGAIENEIRSKLNEALGET